jgi:hypothetical protein
MLVLHLNSKQLLPGAIPRANSKTNKNNCMKKVILSVAMMFAAFLTQAAVGKQVEEVKLKSGEEKMRTVDWGNEASPGEEGLCTITMKGRIDLGPIEAEVSCTTSATTCEAATVTAINCLSAAMKTVRSVIM